MLKGWQHHPGFTVAQLQAHRTMRSVGTRTGLLTGPLLAFDFDGATSLELGLDPGWVSSWQVHRSTDANRLKVLFRPTLEQLSQLPGGAEFQGKTITAPKTDTSKGEAFEIQCAVDGVFTQNNRDKKGDQPEKFQAEPVGPAWKK
jgi:hypothetical protein